MSIKNKILKNTFLISSSGLFLGILNFLVVSILVSNLGFEKYGLFVFILFLSVNNGFMSLFDFGIQSITTKHISHYFALGEYNNINAFISFSLLFSVLIGFLCSLIIFATYDYIKLYFDDINKFNGFFDIFKIFVFSYVLQFLNHTFVGIYEGYQRYDISKGIEIGFYIIQSVLVITVTLLALDIYYFIYIFVLIYLITFLVNITILRKKFAFKFSFLHIRSKFKKFYAMSVHVFPIQLSSMIYNQYPKFFILSFLNIHYLGIYDVVVKIPRFLKTITGFINSALMPIVSELTALGETNNINKIYQFGFRLNIFILIPIATAIMYFASPIFDFWIHDNTNYQYMQVFMIWNLLVPYVTFGGPLLIGMNKELNFMKKVSWSIALLCIFVSFILIDEMKLWGLIYGQLAGFVLLPFVFYKYMKIFNVDILSFTKANIYVFLLAIIPMLIFNFLGNISGFLFLFLSCMIWCVIYWVLIYFFILNEKEKEILQGFLARGRRVYK